MSPHNNARFNGSKVNSPGSYHSDQNELGLAMERLLSNIGGLVYTYSGLRLFMSRRFFKRGIPDNQLSRPALDQKSDGTK
jgi:hypothetical protein